MNIRTTVSPALLLLAALALPTPAIAVQGYLLTTIDGIMVNSSPLPPPATSGLMYGGCMAHLANPVNTATNSPNCTSTWVAFSCDGTYASQSTAQMLLDQAELAWTLHKPVYEFVDDTELHNGFCTAFRMDLY